MGYLSNYKKGNNEDLGELQSTKDDIALSVQIDCLQLVFSAHKKLMADEVYLLQPDETRITAKIVGEIEKLILKEDFSYSIIPDPFEYTEDIIEGRISTKKAKKYDLILENWNNKNKIKFGVEAKLLVETRHKNKRGTLLVKEYVSEAGMGKYISRIYKRKGIMVGYILEGSISAIITNINTEVTNVYSDKHTLKKVNNLFYPEETYLSIHVLSDEDLLLYHLMLDFSSKTKN